MQQIEIYVRVYGIPGGEGASLQVYDVLVNLLDEHEDLFLSVYRGMNRADRRWILTLIGEKTSISRYEEQIQRSLSVVQAEQLSVPPESLAPLIERFLVRQAEMKATNTPFLIKHHPLGKKAYAKSPPPKRKKKGR